MSDLDSWPTRETNDLEVTAPDRPPIVEDAAADWRSEFRSHLDDPE